MKLCFNPYFPGIAAVTGLKKPAVVVAGKFQSLFSWNSCCDRHPETGRHPHNICFNPYFPGIAAVTNTCSIQFKGLKSVSILIFLE